MNRIILIGNGFDVAHGMDTRYGDFMEWLLNEELEHVNRHGESKNELFTLYNCSEENFVDIHHLTNRIVYDEQLDFVNGKYNNKFISDIIKHYVNKNWVDIESIYFENLKQIFKENHYNTNERVRELNKYLSTIQKCLKNYLLLQDQNFIDNDSSKAKIDKSILQHVYSKFKYDELSYEGAKILLEEIKHDVLLYMDEYIERDEKQLSNIDIPKAYREFFDSRYDEVMARKKEIIEEYIEMSFKLDNQYFRSNFPKSILFLNFNYTYTDNLYIEADISNNSEIRDYNINRESIRIHGEIKGNELNDLIFGYGDEMDDDYKDIEKSRDNDFLTHIKSMRYLENMNYKSLLRFINSDNYQIYIFGHSCSNSDRTLLNTLFEHENCRSIKPFWYVKDDGSDNFIELIQNITRNFEIKTKMRDVVVNKERCSSLQN